MLIINVVGLSLLAIFVLFILNKKNKLMSDYALIITICFISGIFIGNLWVSHGLTKINLILEKCIGFYVLPAFLVYAMLLISKDNKIKKQWWWFGSVALVATIFISLDLVLLDKDNQESLNLLYRSPPWSYHFFFRGSNIFAIGALLWFLKQLKIYREKIKNDYSFIENIRFTWLEIFTWLFIINNILIFIISLAFLFGDFGSLDGLYITVYTLIVISLFYLCFKGIGQYSLVEYEHSLSTSELHSNSTVLPTRVKNSPKYESSSLSEDEMNTLSKQINDLMEVQKIYLEHQLKIDKIAIQLGVTIHKISQTINSKEKKSFYDYVNHFRVEHFKRLLSKSGNNSFTLLALGIESGFNSKTSLNRIFKKHTGMSPKEFQKLNKPD